MCMLLRCGHTLFFATDDLLDDMLTFYNASLGGNLYAYLPLSPILVAFRRRLDERDRHLFFSGCVVSCTTHADSLRERERETQRVRERERERERFLPDHTTARPLWKRVLLKRARAHTHTHTHQARYGGGCCSSSMPAKYSSAFATPAHNAPRLSGSPLHPPPLPHRLAGGGMQEDPAVGVCVGG